MKNPVPNTIVPLPSARVWSLLALAALPSLAVASPVAQVVTAEVVAVPTPSTGLRSFSGVDSDQAGSWVAAAFLIGSSSSVLYGVLDGSGTSVPAVLRSPQLLSGYQQEAIFAPRVKGLDIAYTSIAPSPAQGFSSWINDTVIAQPGDPIGTTGLEWFGSSTPRMTSTQRVFVFGTAWPAGGQGQSERVVVRYPAQTLAISTGSSMVGLSGPITGIESFESSPNGTWWTAVVTYESPTTGQEEMAIIDTGTIHAYSTFNRANTENTPWESFEKAYIDNDRVITFMGRDQLGAVVYRDGMPTVRGVFSQLYDIDAEGVVLTDGVAGPGLEIMVNGVSLDRPGAGGVDANGDGWPNAGWAVTGQFTFGQQATFLEDGRIMTLVSLQVPGNGNLQSLVIATLALPGDVVCQGVPNSTGFASSLRPVGVEKASFNDLELLLVNSPGGFTIPLVSNTSGFVANPGGSVGNLCLGGSIGRGIAFAAGGVTKIRVYPLSLPQPNGFVAAQAGETWFFQTWHRDNAGGSAISNFSSALAVTFR